MTDNKYDAMGNVLGQLNSHSVGVMKLIKEYYPAFAKKIFDKNPLMEKMAMANFCTMDILLYPICGRCETLAAYSSYAHNKDGSLMLTADGDPIGVCTCLKCGATTVNPIRFFDWCLMELKKRAPQEIDMSLVAATDMLAERILDDAKKIYTTQKERERFYAKPKQH